MDVREQEKGGTKASDGVVNRRNAKMEGGRAKLVAKGGVTRTAASGSQTSEMEAELPSDDAGERGVTKDAAIVRTFGSGPRTPKGHF